MRPKSKFFTFVLSFFPGAGHMYLGFMKQGLQLMAAFFGTIAIVSMSSLNFFAFLIPIIIAYSFFDALQKCSNQVEPDDSSLDVIKWFFKSKPNSHSRNYKFFAYFMIFMGGYILFENIFINIFINVFNNLYPDAQFNGNHIEDAVRTIILAILFIWGGIKLLSKSKMSGDYEGGEDNA